MRLLVSFVMRDRWSAGGTTFGGTMRPVDEERAELTQEEADELLLLAQLIGRMQARHARRGHERVAKRLALAVDQVGRARRGGRPLMLKSRG